jgi:putative FmdB family regulatory protein
MPIYEYCCKHCGHSLDILQKMSDAPLTLCPHCQQDTLSKLVSAAGFRLSGKGWYETDFKGDTEIKRNLSESSAQAPTDKPVSTETAATKTESSTAASSGAA